MLKKSEISALTFLIKFNIVILQYINNKNGNYKNTNIFKTTKRHCSIF